MKLGSYYLFLFSNTGCRFVDFNGFIRFAHKLSSGLFEMKRAPSDRGLRGALVDRRRSEEKDFEKATGRNSLLVIVVRIAVN